MLDSLNNNTKYFLHFFLSVTLEVLTEEVSFCVLLMQTQASGGEVFCSRSSSRPVAGLQVGSSLPNPSPATNQSFHNLYGCSKNGLWSNTRLHTTNASCYFSTSIPSHQCAEWVQLGFDCLVPKLYNPFTHGKKQTVGELEWPAG